MAIIAACAGKNFFGQAIKSCWWMPRHQKAKKDAKPAKSFGELEKALTRRYPNGATRRANSPSFLPEFIG